MAIHRFIISFVFLIGIFSCKQEEKVTQIPQEELSNDLALDHFNIWVKEPQKAKEKLEKLGFISVPDSLSTVHHGQGTTGKYFYFLNTYLEFIYVYDEEEFEENNKQNQELDFAERVNFQENGTSPFGIALKVKDYDVEKIPFKKVAYHQDWMEEDANIYAAQSSKANLKEPSVFVVYPQIQYDVFETLDDLQRIPEEYAIWREFYKQPNGAKKVTELVITSKDVDLTTETMQALNAIGNVAIKTGADYLMELHFDNDEQGKTFDLRPEIPLKIYL